MFIYPLLILLLQSADCHLTQYSATASGKLLFNGKWLQMGLQLKDQCFMERQYVPLFFQKVAVTSVHKKTKLLFKTPFDESDYIKCR